MASKKKAGAATKAPMKKITKRIVSKKRHTTGYVVGGEELSVAKTRQLASRGQISGVRVVGKHVQSQSGRRRLTDLPTVIK